MTVAHITNPSPLWASAAGIKPIGSPWPRADKCVMCGSPIAKGDLATASDRELFNDSFNNRADCRHEGEAVCGHCMALWNGMWMQASSKSFAVQGQGVFSLLNNPDIAAFVLTPPESAYVAIFNNRKQAHMIWRTPVALPSPYLSVRADDDVIQIDRARVLDGVVAWQTCITILKAVGMPKASPFLLKSIYKLDSELIGLPIERNVKAIEMHSADGIEAIKMLSSLSMADWWALNPITEIDLNSPSTWPRRRTIEQAAKESEDKKAEKAEKAKDKKTSEADLAVEE